MAAAWMKLVKNLLWPPSPLASLQLRSPSTTRWRKKVFFFTHPAAEEPDPEAALQILWRGSSMQWQRCGGWLRGSLRCRGAGGPRSRGRWWLGRISSSSSARKAKRGSAPRGSPVTS